MAQACPARPGQAGLSEAVMNAQIKSQPDTLERIRDIYLWSRNDIESALDDAFAYDGDPVLIEIGAGPHRAWLRELLEHIRREYPNTIDFDLAYDGRLFRAHRDRSIRGDLIALRQVPAVAPGLEDLNLPRWWREFFMAKDLQRGGLILICAVTGQGKSTTVGGIVKSRLTRYGGFCRTIEDPVELPLQGRHGDGMCIQTRVQWKGDERDIGFAGSLRSALRSYPALSGGGTMCVVGEVRDAETAGELVRAAVNGHLVITTVHAGDVPTGVARLLSMAEDGMGPNTARDLVASGLRVAAHQTLTLLPTGEGWQRGRLSGDLLVNTPTVAAVLRGNDVASKLREPLRHQLAQHSRGRNFEEVLSRC
jgi:Tfp pilus assembly pilus retraction ATPase PilT